MPSIRRQLLPAVRMLAVLTVLVGLAYPLAVTGVAQATFGDRADGSLVRGADGRMVGSRLVGQAFASERAFHPRPSSAGAGASGSLVPETDDTGATVVGDDGEPVLVPADTADPANDASGASNLGPTNEALLRGEDDPETPAVDEADDTGIDARIRDYRAVNGLADDVAVPVDAVTGSASGVDPHISVANARLQAPRVAAARDLDVDRVLRLVEAHTEGRSLGVFGEDGVNVLTLNLALDGER